MVPTKKTLNFLIACFFCNVMTFLLYIPAMAMFDMSTINGIQSTEFEILEGIHATFAFGALILWGYCIYFFYKYDRYSKGILKIMFFPGLFSMFYFYKVIWKRKRPLENSLDNSEPVLGKTVHLIEEDD